MPKLNKKKLKGRYVQQRKEGKEAYVEKFGSAKGWKSSDEFKRIAKNEKQAFYRYDQRKELKRTDSPSSERFEISGDFQPYWLELPYGDGVNYVVTEVFELAEDEGKEVAFKLKRPGMKDRIYYDPIKIDEVLSDLYFIAEEIGSDSACKTALVITSKSAVVELTTNF